MRKIKVKPIKKLPTPDFQAVILCPDVFAYNRFVQKAEEHNLFDDLWNKILAALRNEPSAVSKC